MPQFKQFPLPDTGEGLVDAEILAWHVKPGDTVTVNQIIVEIETSKAAVELPCPWAGVVSELMVQVGQTVDVGTPIISIDTDPNGAAPSTSDSNGANGVAPAAAKGGLIGEETEGGRIANLVGYGSKAGSAKRRARKDSGVKAPVAQAPAPPVSVPAAPVPVAPVPVASTVDTWKAAEQGVSGGYVPLAKPPVRKLAKELGVDLRALAGSGPDGVITREDVEQAVSNGSEVSAADSSAPAVGYDPATRERRVPIKGVRKATAAAMVQSAYSAPHVTVFLTVDVTPMMELRARLKSHPEFRDAKLSPLAFAARAVCLAVRRTPDVNATWDEQAQEIVYKSYVHLGIAAATPRGLVVPKIRDADSLSLRELAQALERLTGTAREGKSTPADMAGGTFTISNIGVFGVDTGTPIINPGESAILALGTIKDTPWVVDGQVVPRKVCQLALSFDHRVVDGQQGAQFLADVGALMADPAMAITY